MSRRVLVDESDGVVHDEARSRLADERARGLEDAAYLTIRSGASVVARGEAATEARREIREAIVVPDLAAVAANAWTRPHSMERGEIQAAIVAVLRANGAPMDRRQARLASLLCLEPHLLATMLDKSEKAQWARVVGGDAKKAASASIDATSQEWGAALAGLRGRERVLEDLEQNTWALGTDTEAIDTAGWPDGRAGFVVNTLRRLQQSMQADAIILNPPRTIADVRHDLVSTGRCPECAMVVNRRPSRAAWTHRPDDHLAEAVEEMGFILGRQVGDAKLQARRAEQTRIEVVHVLVHLFAWALFDEEAPAEPARTIDPRGQVSLWAGL